MVVLADSGPSGIGSAYDLGTMCAYPRCSVFLCCKNASSIDIAECLALAEPVRFSLDFLNPQIRCLNTFIAFASPHVGGANSQTSLLSPFTPCHSLLILSSHFGKQVWRKTRTGRKKMSVKWLRELEKRYPELAETARRLNAEDGFVMDTGGRRRRADGDRDSDGSGINGKRKKKHSKKKSSSRSDSGVEGGGGDSGSGGSSPKRGRKYGSDVTAEDSLTPPSRSGGRLA